jgi:hypothetical protein
VLDYLAFAQSSLRCRVIRIFALVEENLGMGDAGRSNLKRLAHELVLSVDLVFA